MSSVETQYFSAIPLGVSAVRRSQPCIRDSSSPDGSYCDEDNEMRLRGLGDELTNDFSQSGRGLAVPNHPHGTHQSGRPGPPSFPSPLMTTCRMQQPFSISFWIGSAAPTSLAPATPGLGHRNSFHQD
ncbi:hypothetical protein FRB94_005660 [Tulasnella sp. JGI-2019a]|nr:hypothetical protein FRB94_005660 [Tulasnella sp. JGI-2019a]KAG9007244.1 hypothetical protein FRB93_008067 [Tulasnella sp. JGI-2019a]KAG9023130.1 hypothetical protein FRB95_013544 [Tulasnella sp. JGI-2019a]